MFNILFPPGSRRRNKLRQTVILIKRKRSHNFRKTQYNHWRKQYYLLQKQPNTIAEDTLFSIIVPCYNTPINYLMQLLNSVFSQSYSNWELIIVDASSNAKLSQKIKDQCIHDVRIKYIKTSNEGIALNTNKGIEAASGDYICFLDHDDVLDPHALYENAKAIIEHLPDLIYSDEDKIDEYGNNYFSPHLKPDFSIDLLRSVNYITHFVCVKKAISNRAGNLRTGYEGAQDYDFLLRVVDVTDQIHHITSILYHWRQTLNSTASNFDNKKYATKSGVKALEDHYARRKIEASVKAITNRPGFYHTKYTLNKNIKRAVVLCFKENTPQILKEYIIKKYRKLDEIKNHLVSVIEIDDIKDLPLNNFNQLLLVRGLIAPTHVDNSLNNAFGVLQEGDVFSTIRQISSNKIINCGFVYDNYQNLIPLFAGFDPMMTSYFGSIEWNRNVNGIDTNLIGFNTKRLSIQQLEKPIFSDNDGHRLVCFGEYEYQLFGDDKHNSSKTFSQKTYFNKDLSYEVYPLPDFLDLIVEKLELDK